MKCEHEWKIIRNVLIGGKYRQIVKCLKCGKERDEPQTTPMFAWIKWEEDNHV